MGMNQKGSLCHNTAYILVREVSLYGFLVLHVCDKPANPFVHDWHWILICQKATERYQLFCWVSNIDVHD